MHTILPFSVKDSMEKKIRLNLVIFIVLLDLSVSCSQLPTLTELHA